MEKESSGQRPVEANSTGGQGSRRAIAPSDDDDDDYDKHMHQQTSVITVVNYANTTDSTVNHCLLQDKINFNINTIQNRF
jgi:hypothetical protein